MLTGTFYCWLLVYPQEAKSNTSIDAVHYCFIIAFWYVCLLSIKQLQNVPSIKQLQKYQHKYPIKSNENSFWHSEQDYVFISIDK